MKKTWVTLLSLFLIFQTLPAKAGPYTLAQAATLLTNCVNAINDPLYTRSLLPGKIGFASELAVENAIAAGTLGIFIANGAGVITAINNSNSQDLYCGDSNNNSIAFMDSSSDTQDYFFGGAGNDSVTGEMWFSTFYGGPGDDYVNKLTERSSFYGGPGNDSVTTISTGTQASFFDQGVDDSTAPTLSSAVLNSAGTAITLTYNEALSATTAATSAFTVLDSGSVVTVSSATASGSAVTLALGSTINIGRVVTVSYSDPTAGDDANALQDLVGNDAASLTSQSVTNNSTVKATQAIITITSSASVSFGSTLALTSTGGSTGGTFTYTVISGSCTIEGSTLTPTSSGTCVIRSSLAENDNYLAAQSADTTINISKTSVSATIELIQGALTYRQAKSVTASSSVAGKVTFKVNGKVIPRCKKRAVLASASVICSYRPSTRGYVVITATLNPTDNSYIGTTTTTSRYFVGNRTGKRAG